MKNFVSDHDHKLSFAASQIVAPAHTTGDSFTNIAGAQQGVTIPVNLVEGGDPVVIGRIVGVAAYDALRSTDLVTVYTRGVYNLAVKSTHHSLTVGESIFIDPSTAVLSDDLTGVPFGVVLDAVAQYATTTVRVMVFCATPGAIGAGS